MPTIRDKIRCLETMRMEVDWRAHLHFPDKTYTLFNGEEYSRFNMLKLVEAMKNSDLTGIIDVYKTIYTCGSMEMHYNSGPADKQHACYIRDTNEEDIDGFGEGKTVCASVILAMIDLSIKKLLHKEQLDKSKYDIVTEVMGMVSSTASSTAFTWEQNRHLKKLAEVYGFTSADTNDMLEGVEHADYFKAMLFSKSVLARVSKETGKSSKITVCEGDDGFYYVDASGVSMIQVSKGIFKVPKNIVLLTLRILQAYEKSLLLEEDFIGE